MHIYALYELREKKFYILLAKLENTESQKERYTRRRGQHCAHDVKHRIAPLGKREKIILLPEEVYHVSYKQTKQLYKQKNAKKS